MIVCFKNLRCYYNFSYCTFYSSLKIFLMCLVETGFILLLSINLSLDTFELVSKIISAEKENHSRIFAQWKSANSPQSGRTQHFNKEGATNHIFSYINVNIRWELGVLGSKMSPPSCTSTSLEGEHQHGTMEEPGKRQTRSPSFPAFMKVCNVDCWKTQNLQKRVQAGSLSYSNLKGSLWTCWRKQVTMLLGQHTE